MYFYQHMIYNKVYLFCLFFHAVCVIEKQVCETLIEPAKHFALLKLNCPHKRLIYQDNRIECSQYQWQMLIFNQANGKKKS